jgi:hypothetical protein
LALCLGGGLVYARPILATGTGYAAHNACAVRFVAGRGPQAPAADLPDNPLVPYLRTTVDPGNAAATASILGVLFRQTASADPDTGCTLGWRPTDAPPPSAVAAAPDSSTLPTVDTPADPAVTAAVAAAFGAGGDQALRRALGTRAVVVVHHGRIVAERYADGFTPQTRQLGWSMAKSVTNLLAGRLVQQGRLSLDEDHLRPEWTDGRAAITVEDLLRMTSGLQWDETYALGTPITTMLYRDQDMAGYAASLPLAHEVGTYQQYSSGTTNILGQVLHERSGMGAEMPRRLLFDPMGLTSPVWETDVAGHLVASSYLWATPRDWAAIGQFALQNGELDGERLLPAGWMQTSASPTAVATEEDAFGASWWANRRVDGTLRHPLMPSDTYWASGHDGQQLVVVPSADLVVVRLGFTPTDVDLGVDRMIADVIPALED